MRAPQYAVALIVTPYGRNSTSPIKQSELSGQKGQHGTSLGAGNHCLTPWIVFWVQGCNDIPRTRLLSQLCRGICCRLPCDLSVFSVPNEPKLCDSLSHHAWFWTLWQTKFRVHLQCPIDAHADQPAPWLQHAQHCLGYGMSVVDLFKHHPLENFWHHYCTPLRAIHVTPCDSTISWWMKRHSDLWTTGNERHLAAHMMLTTRAFAILKLLLRGTHSTYHRMISWGNRQLY